jgi:hypothetical protein
LNRMTRITDSNLAVSGRPFKSKQAQ